MTFLRSLIGTLGRKPAPAPEPEPAPAAQVDPGLLAFISAQNRRLAELAAERANDGPARTNRLIDDAQALAHATRDRRAEYARTHTTYARIPPTAQARITAPRPCPTVEQDAPLTPWERAWARLTADEKKWSSR